MTNKNIFSAGHIIGTVFLLGVGVYIALLLQAYFFRASYTGFVITSIVLSLISLAIVRSWFEGMIVGFLSGGLFLYAVASKYEAHILEMTRENIPYISNFIVSNLYYTGEKFYYFVLIYLAVPMLLGMAIGYRRQKKLNEESGPYESKYVPKSDFATLVEEKYELLKNQKETNEKLSILKENLHRLPQKDENSEEYQHIVSQIEYLQNTLSEIENKLHSIELKINTTEIFYSAPLCPHDNFPLRLVSKGGHTYVWKCDLCGKYIRENLDWVSINNLTHEQINERVSKLIDALNKIDKKQFKSKNKLKNKVTHELNKLLEERSEEIGNFEVLPDSIPIVCPQCGFKSSSTPNYIGKKVQCPNCNFTFEVHYP